MNLDKLKNLIICKDVNENNFSRHALHENKYQKNLARINAYRNEQALELINAENPIDYFFRDCTLIKNYLNEFSTNSRADQYLCISTLLGAISSVVSKDCYWFDNETRKHPNLYMVCLAPRNWGKTPIFEGVFEPIFRNYVDNLGRYYQQLTIEFAQIPLKNDNILRIASDELNGFFNLSNYNPTQYSTYESFYNSGFSNGRYTPASLSNKDNIYDGALIITIFGLMQPEFVSKIFKGSNLTGEGSGFANRFLFCRYLNTQGTAKLANTSRSMLNVFCERLKKLKFNGGNEFEFTAEQTQMIAYFQEDNSFLQQILSDYGVNPETFATPKIQQQILKLALLFEIIKLADNDLVGIRNTDTFSKKAVMIDNESIDKALMFYLVYLYPCYVQTFSEATERKYKELYDKESEKINIVEEVKADRQIIIQEVERLVKEGKKESDIVNFFKNTEKFKDVSRHQIQRIRKALGETKTRKK